MPIYLYECERCDKWIQVIQSLSGEPPICCNEAMRRLPTFPAKIGMKGIHSQGYKEGYSKEYLRRLEEAKS